MLLIMNEDNDDAATELKNWNRCIEKGSDKKRKSELI